GAAGSGGTIANRTSDGILLSGTRGVSLSRMQIQGNPATGIRGTNVSGFQLLNSSLLNNHPATGGDGAGLRLHNLTGNASISGSTIAGGAEDNVRLTADSGTLDNLSVTDTTIGPNSPSLGGNGMQ